MSSTPLLTAPKLIAVGAWILLVSALPLLFVGGAMLMGTVGGLVLGVVVSFTIVLRIFLEEKLLARDLQGHREYRHRVRYRLVPHLW